MPEQPARRVVARMILQLLTVALLISMLVTQLMILARMPHSPPTLADFLQAGANRREVMQSLPLVRVQGGSLEIEGGSIDVDVQNTPLEVQIQR